MAKKQPKLVLRESCVHDLSKRWPAGDFLEMGAGTGEMTKIFLDRGFHGACYDLGADSRQMIRARLAGYADRIRVVDEPAEMPLASFDYLFAFEVLEHIEDDLGALKRWAEFLRPGGRLLLTVPAHQRKYGRSDELVGHVRRYERAQLRQLLVDAGFAAEHIVNYGFPITELTRRVSNRMIRNDSSYDEMTPEQRSVRSAQAKPKAVQRVLSVFGGNMFLPFCVTQRWFYPFDLGDGLAATAVKSAG